MPTRNARNGHLFTRFGDLRLATAATRKTSGPSMENLQLPCVPELLPGLPASPRPLRRDARAHADDHPQPALLPESRRKIREALDAGRFEAWRAQFRKTAPRHRLKQGRAWDAPCAAHVWIPVLLARRAKPLAGWPVRLAPPGQHGADPSACYGLWPAPMPMTPPDPDRRPASWRLWWTWPLALLILFEVGMETAGRHPVATGALAPVVEPGTPHPAFARLGLSRGAPGLKP